MRNAAPITPEQALLRLQDLCSRAEYCRYELRQKLFKWGIRNADADEVLAQLEADHFFSDKRFAHAFSRTHLSQNKWGSRKIALALAAKRIDRRIIDETVQEVTESDAYLQTLRDLVAAYGRRVPHPVAYEDKTKVYRSLLARGFEAELISKAIKNL